MSGRHTQAALPEAFNWQAYLKWNPELQADGITTREAAEQHFRSIGAGQKLVYQDYDLTLRYTACGGLMNQHYCHLSALVLAHLCHAKRVIWPPMQERTSFSRRYHPNADKNEQSWLYMDANSLWDVPNIQQRVKGASFAAMHQQNALCRSPVYNEQNLAAISHTVWQHVQSSLELRSSSIQTMRPFQT